MSLLIELSNYPNYYIQDYPPVVYQKTNEGLIECVQTPSSRKDPYPSVTVRNTEGRHVKRSLHRLLMLTFVPNPDNLPHVNHIDGDKTNSILPNLEWCSCAENTQHAHNMGLCSYTTKEVHQYLLNGSYVNSFPSDVAASVETGIPKGNISQVTRNIRIHAGYYQWSRERVEEMPAITHSYVKSYTYDGVEFSTLKLLGEHLGIANPSKFALAKMGKKKREQVILTYYD